MAGTILPESLPDLGDPQYLADLKRGNLELYRQIRRVVLLEQQLRRERAVLARMTDAARSS